MHRHFNNVVCYLQLPTIIYFRKGQKLIEFFYPKMLSILHLCSAIYRQHLSTEISRKLILI